MSSLHEWSILGYLVNENDMLDSVATRISEEHFSDAKAMKVFSAMKEMREFEVPTLSTRVNDHKAMELLIAHGDEIVTAQSIPRFCKSIIDDYAISEQRTFVDELKDRLKERKLDGLADFYEHQANNLRSIVQLDSDDIEKYSLNHEYRNYMDDIDQPQRSDLIPFYLPTINESLGYGVPPGSLVMLSGTPKDGKSTIALQQTWWLSEKHYPVAFFSFEQRTRELFEIMVGQRAKVPGIKIRNRTWDMVEKERTIGAAKYLSHCPIYVIGIEKTDPLHCFEQIRRLAENGVKWITIDHLQLMCDGSGEKGYTYKIKDVTRRLKLLAGQLDIVIFLIAQNQQSADTVRTWGSNVPEQDVDAWLVFKRPSKDDPKCSDPDYMILHRNRLPGSKRIYVETIWNPNTNLNFEIRI